MRHFFLAFAGSMALCATPAGAQNALPDGVAELYRTYQGAEEGGDPIAIVEAADAVFRAAERARVDDETLAVLAENLGYYAQAARQYERAYDAWRFSARRTERAQGEGVVSGYRWQQAALAAHALGDADDARRCAINASEGFEAAEQLEDEFIVQTAVESHLLAAQLNAQSGEYEHAGRAADRALALFDEQARASDRLHAMALYFAGFRDVVEGAFDDGALRLHLAADMFEMLSSGTRDGRVAHLLSELARRRHAEESVGRRVYLNQSDGLAAARETYRAAFEERILLHPMYSERGLAHRERDRDAGHTATPEDAQPLVRTEPPYPRSAAERGHQGFVIVEFDITADGEVVNPDVLVSVPGGVFDGVVVGTVLSWEYAPTGEGGEELVRENIGSSFTFQLFN